MLRRQFIQAGLSAGLTLLLPSLALAQTSAKGRVIIIGGGFAGATAAKYLRLWGGDDLEIIVIETHTTFVSCPLSNLVLGGSKKMGDLTFNYAGLDQYRIKRLYETVTAIDAEKRKVLVDSGDELHYDRLIIAPGVDFNYEQWPSMLSDEAQKEIPHAWKAGKQTVALRKQLEAMQNGGVFVMTIPPAPYRCPPGPYERVCQVASYLKANKPKSKIIVLDANPEIVSKKGLFTKNWAEMYPDMIDYRPNSPVIDVDAKARTVKTEFDMVKANVLNIIPPQLAGKPAQFAGLNSVSKRWCEVDFLTYESKVAPNIHVIGDAVSAALPKSAHMATSQAKVCASAVANLLAGQMPDQTPVFANTCYSYVNDKMAMHVANVYRYDTNKKIMVSAEGGGVSQAPSELEAGYAQAWAKNIWSDVLT